MSESQEGIRRVLVVDDEESMREMLQIMLKRLRLDVQVAESADNALDLFEAGERFSAVITDLNMPGKNSGLDLLEEVKRLDTACQVIVITAFATPETAVEAIKLGAYDYLTKPFKLDQVRMVLERALEKYALLSENLYLRQEQERYRPVGIIGDSEPMRRVMEMVHRVARTKTTILITGESGTGKELIAQAIHEASPFKGPFVPVNCGAIPETLIEAELFGYKKGAFTGANQDHKGLVESARGGTLFLDEIGELPLGAQVRLLRVLQEKKVKPVGGVEEISIDVRIVAATNRELKEEVEQGRFREDLYYRLNVIPIELPPLRERGHDVQLLLKHFVRHYSEELGVTVEGISAPALAILLDYDYPGNVRELQNIVERAVTLELTTMIGVEALPPTLRPSQRPIGRIEVPPEGMDLEDTLQTYERGLLEAALEQSGGVKTEAARLLGISFRSFRYRLQKLGLDDDESNTDES